MKNSPRNIQPGDCACCDSGANVDTALHRMIHQVGWGIIGITDSRRPFAYTVGLTSLGLPELYTTVPIPMMITVAHRDLNDAAQQQKETNAALAGQVTVGTTVYTTAPMKNTQPLAMARRVYPGGFTALELRRPSAAFQR